MVKVCLWKIYVYNSFLLQILLTFCLQFCSKLKLFFLIPLPFVSQTHTIHPPCILCVSGEVLVYTHIHTYTLQKFTANVLSRFQSLLMKDDYVRFFRSLELFFAAVLQFFSLHNHLCSYTCHQHAVQKHFPVNLPVSVFHGFFFLSFYCLLLVFCIVLFFFFCHFESIVICLADCQCWDWFSLLWQAVCLTLCAV